MSSIPKGTKQVMLEGFFDIVGHRQCACVNVVHKLVLFQRGTGVLSVGNFESSKHRLQAYATKDLLN
jgi:hypothetical protein